MPFLKWNWWGFAMTHVETLLPTIPENESNSSMRKGIYCFCKKMENSIPNFFPQMSPTWLRRK